MQRSVTGAIGVECVSARGRRGPRQRGQRSSGKPRRKDSKPSCPVGPAALIRFSAGFLKAVPPHVPPHCPTRVDSTQASIVAATRAGSGGPRQGHRSGWVRPWAVRMDGAGVRRGIGKPRRRLDTRSSTDDPYEPTQVPGPLRKPGGPTVTVGVLHHQRLQREGYRRPRFLDRQRRQRGAVPTHRPRQPAVEPRPAVQRQFRDGQRRQRQGDGGPRLLQGERHVHPAEPAHRQPEPAVEAQPPAQRQLQDRQRVQQPGARRPELLDRQRHRGRSVHAQRRHQPAVGAGGGRLRPGQHELHR